MGSLVHWLEYLVVRVGLTILGWLPAWVADQLGGLLGSLSHAVLTSRRRVAEDNLRKTIAGDWSQERVDQVVSDAFQNIGRTIIEFLRQGRLTHKRILKISTGPGLDELSQRWKTGSTTGTVVVTAHFGNWELAGGWFLARGCPMSFLVGEQRNQKVNELIVNLRRALGAKIIPLRTSLRGVLKTLRSGGVVGFAVDQHAPSEALIMDFLGRKASVARGAATFAVKTHSAILPMMLRRERYDHHVMAIGDLILPPESGDNEADVKEMTIAYTRFFEEQIKLYPEQYMWTHKRWKVK